MNPMCTSTVTNGQEGGAGQVQGLGALRDGNWVWSHQPTSPQEDDLEVVLQAQHLKGSNPAPPLICCVLLGLFLDTPDSVSPSIKIEG